MGEVIFSQQSMQLMFFTSAEETGQFVISVIRLTKAYTGVSLAPMLVAIFPAVTPKYNVPGEQQSINITAGLLICRKKIKISRGLDSYHEEIPLLVKAQCKELLERPDYDSFDISSSVLIHIK